MQRLETRAMVEAGFLTALVVILSLIVQLAPILAIGGSLFWPIPIAILGLRHGVKWSALATLSAFVIVSFVLGPVVALTEATTLGAVGILLGAGLRHDWSFLKRVLLPGTAFFVTSVLHLVILIYILQIDVAAMWQQVYDQSMANAMSIYQNAGWSAEELAEAKARMEAQMSLFKMILPTGLFLSGVILSYIDNILVSKITHRMGISVRDIPPFFRWEMPRETIYAFVLSWVMVYWGNTQEIAWLSYVGSNLQTLAIFVLSVQGISFLDFLGRRAHIKKGWRILFFVVAFMVPLFQVILWGAGLFDMTANYRRSKNYEIS